MSNVEEAVVLVLVTFDTLGVELVVVNPDVGSLIQGESIFSFLGSIKMQVPDNDIADLLDAEATTRES